MKHLKNFTLYTPEKEETADLRGYEAYYIRDENGVDWYKAQAQFDKSSLKVFYDASGLVIAATDGDVSGYFPVNLSVVELQATDKNLKVKADGTWFYQDGKLQQIRDYVAIATAERNRLLNDASKAIAPFQDAADTGMATDEELRQLKAWKTYRVLLNRVDVNAAPDIDWPEKLV